MTPENILAHPSLDWSRRGYGSIFTAQGVD